MSDSDHQNRPLNILLSAYALSSIRGSEPGNSWRLAEGLALAGHRVTVLTSLRYPGEHEVPSDLRDNLTLEFVDASAPRILRRGQVGVYAKYRAWQLASLRRTRHLLHESPDRFDVVHHYSWGSLMWGSPLTAMGLPFVFGPVGGASTSPRVMQTLYRPRDRWKERIRALVVAALPWNPLSRSTVKSSSVVLAANSDSARLIDRIGVPTSLMMPETTPESWIGRPVPTRHVGQSVVVIWVARLLPIKGILLAIDIATRLPPTYELHIIGDGPELHRARRHVSDLSLDPRVIFRGALPWNDLPEFYDSADVMLFTSIRDTTGAQLLEAGSRGLPIVAINHQGVGDYVPKEAGHLEDLSTPEDMAAGMASGLVDLCSDVERYRSASTAARQYAVTHSRGAATEQLVAAYRRAMEAHALKLRQVNTVSRFRNLNM